MLGVGKLEGTMMIATELPAAPTSPFTPFEWSMICIIAVLAATLIWTLVKFWAPRWVKETAGAKRDGSSDAPSSSAVHAAHEAQIEAHIEEDNRRFDELKTILTENHRESSAKLDRVLTESNSRFDKMLELHTQTVAIQATHAAKIEALENTGAHTAIARLTEKTNTLEREVQGLRGKMSSASLSAVKPR